MDSKKDGEKNVQQLNNNFSDFLKAYSSRIFDDFRANLEKSIPSRISLTWLKKNNYVSDMQEGCLFKMSSVNKIFAEWFRIQTFYGLRFDEPGNIYRLTRKTLNEIPLEE